MEKICISSDKLKYLNFSNLPEKSFKQNFFMPKVFLWNGSYYSYERLEKVGDVDVILITPENINDAVEMLVDIFVFQNGGSDISFLQLILQLKDWGMPDADLFDLLEKRFGKRFSKKISMYEKLLSKDRTVLQLFIAKNISPKVLVEIKNDSLIDLVKEIVNETSINSNSVENIASWITETSVRENISIEQVIEESSIISLMKKDELSGAYILREVKDRFWKLRYPKWAEKRAKLKSLTDSIKSESGIKIAYPDFGEGNRLTLEYTIKKEKDIKNFAKNMTLVEDKISELLKKVQI